MDCSSSVTETFTLYIDFLPHFFFFPNRTQTLRPRHAQVFNGAIICPPRMYIYRNSTKSIRKADRPNYLRYDPDELRFLSVGARERGCRGLVELPLVVRHEAAHVAEAERPGDGGDAGSLLAALEAPPGLIETQGEAHGDRLPAPHALEGIFERPRPDLGGMRHVAYAERLRQVRLHVRLGAPHRFVTRPPQGFVGRTL